jgi:indolepyruvate ferredoxin oxidoreductase alpha subunit
VPVLLRMTTRVCHSKTIVRRGATACAAAAPHFERDIPSRVMIPAYARPAHRRLRKKLAEMANVERREGPKQRSRASKALGIITSGIAFQHVREAAPEASVLKLGMTYPLPSSDARLRRSVERCVVIEEGDPYLVERRAPRASRSRASPRCSASAN